MSHQSESVFIKQLDEAATIVQVGANYVHSKSGGKYTVESLVIIEETEEIGVVYRAQYGEKLAWLRTLGHFTDIIEINGKKVARFVKEVK